MSSKLQALLLAVVSAGLGAVVTYMTTGQKPDPVEVTCEAAQAVLASAACHVEPEVKAEEPKVEDALPAAPTETPLPPEEMEGKAAEPPAQP